MCHPAILFSIATVPLIYSLSPPSIPAVGSPFDVEIVGANLLPSSTVTVNGSSRLAGYYLYKMLLQLTAADLATPGSLSAVVTNPGSQPLKAGVGMEKEEENRSFDASDDFEAVIDE